MVKQGFGTGELWPQSLSCKLWLFPVRLVPGRDERSLRFWVEEKTDSEKDFPVGDELEVLGTVYRRQNK